MRVKVCGICRPEDAALAAAAGADYLGVILAPGGPRSQVPGRAAEIFAAGVGACRAGVFVDPAPDVVVAAAERLGLAVVQLHGAEPPERLAELRRAGVWEVWKALRPRDRAEFMDGVARYAGVADALLVDGWSGRAAGGTGTPFPWEEVATARADLPSGVRLVAAGGLRPDNVAEAVARLAPDIVDVSSGVERVVGQKDPALVRAFIAAARGCGPGGTAPG